MSWRQIRRHETQNNPHHRLFIWYRLRRGTRFSRPRLARFCKLPPAGLIVTADRTGFESPLIDYDDTATIKGGLAEVLAATGGTLDVLYNNGAFACPGAVEDLPRDALRRFSKTMSLASMS